MWQRKDQTSAKLNFLLCSQFNLEKLSVKSFAKSLLCSTEVTRKPTISLAELQEPDSLQDESVQDSTEAQT